MPNFVLSQESTFPKFSGTKEEFGDFLIRADLFLCYKANATEGTGDPPSWLNFFFDADDNPQWGKDLNYYAYDFRLWAALLVRNKEIENASIKIRGLVVLETLTCLAGSDVRDVMSLKKAVTEACELHVFNKRTLAEFTDELFLQYFRSEEIFLSEQTRKLLNGSTAVLENLKKKIVKMLSSTDKNRIRGTDARNQRPASYEASRADAKIYRLDNSVFMARLECLMELCAEQCLESDSSLEELIEEQWSSVFPEIDYASDMEHRINRCLHDKQQYAYLWAMRSLIPRKSLKRVDNQRNIRAIIITRSVHLALALMPGKLNTGNVTDETLALIRRVDFLSVGREEEDIKNCLSRYSRDGAFDRDVIDVFRAYKELFKKAFARTEEEVNSKSEFARIRLEEQKQKLSEMSARIEHLSLEALKEFIAKLADGDYGFILGRLYRFAAGYDDYDVERAREIVLYLFRVMSLCGVNSMCADLLDEELSEEDITENNIVPMADTDRDEKRLLFPGWEIFGQRVAYPVYDSTDSDSKEAE